MKTDSVKDLKAYEIIKEKDVKDLNSRGMLLRHKKTGARIFLLSNDDDNKVFYIGFRTPPIDSTGLTHILEHSVLCGSKKYPVKDPFVELVKGSLNTFLNAMTYPDKTVYPIASCNDKDFNNLMGVYLDAVFYPNIYREEKIFRQEGWHYELDSKDGEIGINGVVYNEMKGAFSSPESALEREIFNALFPDTAYGFESGGDPDHIPELSYEKFMEFHRSYYHPSNSYIYLYGDMDMAERLDYLDREYLGAFDRRDINTEILLQKPFNETRYVEKEYGITTEESTNDKTYLSINYVLDTSLNKELYVAFDILETVLLASPGAPVTQALLDSGIGSDIQSTYESGVYQPYFSIIAENANLKDLERFKQIINDTLRNLVKNGIDKKALRAAVNTLEFKYREADYGGYPKGLFYGLDSFDSWLYDETDPFMHIEANDTYALMRERIETGYFEGLIEEYLLNNPHSAVVVLKPKKGLTAEKDEMLREKMAELKKSLSEDEIIKLVEDTRALREYQETEDSKEAMETIPLLKISDITKEAKPFQYKENKTSGIPVLTHEIFTNGVGYLTVLFDIKDVGTGDLKYVGMLKSVLGLMSTEHFTYNELFNEIFEKSGGIIPSTMTYFYADNSGRYTTAFSFEAKVFENSLKFAFDMIKEMIKTTKLEDEKRLKELTGIIKSRMQASMISSGHSLAAHRALSGISAAAAQSEHMSGVNFYRYIEKLDSSFDEIKEDLITGMRRVMNIIFRKENMFVDYTVTDPDHSDILKLTEEFADCLYKDPYEKGGDPLTLFDEKTGYKTASKIQYVAKAGNFIRSGLKYTGALRVMKVMLGYDYLWTNVRVKGGAYGCMSSFLRNGDCYFTSYRDPNLKKTLEIYDKAPEYLEGFDADERDMTKYIIGAVSALDTPLTPSMAGKRAMSLYLAGEKYENLQRERDQVINCTKEDIRALAPYVRVITTGDHICVVGSEEKIEEDKDIFDVTENLTYGQD
ncbi:MAG: insulinase family protein [Lachnospiraceae bacterium]|nr:insulinase family protein [Lachnospiraceae bacterium]